MSLAGTLSAMRRLMLDRLELPPQEPARIEMYLATFPDLTVPEAEDLAKIAPEKFRTYSKVIFNGERETIDALLPITCELLRARYKAAHGKRLMITDLVHQVHDSRPWKGNATAVLLANFAAFLHEDRDDLRAVAPEAADLADLERRTILVGRSPDDSPSPRDGMEPAELASLTVENLLELDFVVPKSVHLERFNFDVVNLRDGYYEHGGRIPEEPFSEQPTFAAASRDSELRLHWTPLSRELHDFLKSSPRGEPVELGTLAETSISLSYSDDEAEQFRDFVTLLTGLMRSGVVVLRRPANG